MWTIALWFVEEPRKGKGTTDLYSNWIFLQRVVGDPLADVLISSLRLFSFLPLGA